MASSFVKPGELGLSAANPDDNMLALCQMLTDAGIWLGPRRALEENPHFRQIIPYVMLRNPQGQYLFYRRGSTGEESRLHSKLSMGFGGHVDLPDVATVRNEIDLMQTLSSATQRELEEEVGLTLGTGLAEFAGLIIADDTEVDRVHLGVALVVSVASVVSSKEDSQLELQWLYPDEVFRDHDPQDLEVWTNVLLTAATNALPAPDVD